MKVFCLEHSDYALDKTYFFEGPDTTTEADFKKLCDSLINEAAQEALKNKGITWKEPDEEDLEYPFHVGWDSIIEVVTKLLPKYGFQQISLPTVCYTGSSIIHGKFDIYENMEDIHKLIDEDVLKAIVEHNEEIGC